MVRLVMMNKLSIVILKGLLTTTFLVRVCAANKSLNFINWLFLRCNVPFSIKEVCVLSLIPSFIVLLLKGCLGLLQYLLHCLCGRFIDYLDFMVVLGTPLFFCICFFYMLPVSLIISHTIHIHFSENAQFCFLLTGLASFPCTWILFNDGCHLYVIYDITTEYLL